MAFVAALALVGKRQGAFDSPLSIGERDGVIRVTGVRHSLVLPRDLATGKASGRRQHGAITITKEIDQASPPLRAAWAANEPFDAWRLDLFGVDGSGALVVAYTIELTEAAISQIDLVMPSTLDAANHNVPVHEHVSFAYESVTWTWGGNVTAADTWADDD